EELLVRQPPERAVALIAGRRPGRGPVEDLDDTTVPGGDRRSRGGQRRLNAHSFAPLHGPARARTSPVVPTLSCLLCRDHLGDPATHEALHARTERQEDGEILTPGIFEVAIGIEALDLRCRRREATDQALTLLLGHAEDPLRLLDQLGGDL